jgi:hypothetical protein
MFEKVKEQGLKIKPKECKQSIKLRNGEGKQKELVGRSYLTVH